MQDNQIREYECQLKTRLAKLENRLASLEDALDNPASANYEDRATEREDDEVMEQLGQAGIEEIAQIKAALQRIENNTFGICAKCSDEILHERLALLPHTPFCRNCA